MILSILCQSAHFRRIIHQQAQVSSLETCYSNLESQIIVLLSKYTVISMVFTKLLLENTLGIRPYNYEATSEPVLSLRYTGKCAARVLKRSAETNVLYCSWLVH